MKRILLMVMPPEGEVRDRMTRSSYKNPAVKYMPLGILSIAANIPTGYQISVLDASSHQLNLEQTIAEIEEFAPDILGLSVVTYRAWAMTEILRRTCVPIKVVGGPHATYNYEEIIRQGAHAVFVGDGERTFPRWLQEGCRSGIFYGGSVPLDDIPFPARYLLDPKDYMIDPSAERWFDVGALRFPMYSSKGCPMHCIYCDVQQKTYNFKSPWHCAEEFKSLISLGATSIHVMDDAFNINKARVRSLANRIIRNQINVDWSARGTVETHEDIIIALAEAGCKRLHVGIEHLDDYALAYLNKWQRLKDIQRFCGLCNKHGIMILGYFIIGIPGETEQYRRDLPSMIRDLGIQFPFFNLLTPLYMTAYYSQLLSEGSIARDYWGEFCANPVRDFIMPTGRDEEETLELQATIDDYVAQFKGA